MSGILSDSELVSLGRIKLGIDMIEKLILHLNAITKETGLELRHVEYITLALLSNDISRLAKAHEQAELEIKASAQAILDNNLETNNGNFSVDPKND